MATPPSTFCTVAGAVLVGHFLFVAIRFVYLGTPEDMLWLSHAGTLVGGIGLLARSRYMVMMALVALLESHSIWVVDALCWLLLGRHPLGVTFYLDRQPWTEWLPSLNHFFTVPLLAIAAYRSPGVERKAWLGASVLFVFLLSVSAAMPAESNVNSAHRVWPGLDQTFFGQLDAWPRPVYLPALAAVMIIGNFLPVNWLLSWLLGRRGQGKSHTN